MPPNIAMPTATLATMASMAVRLARTLSGTSGSGARRSTRRVTQPRTSVATTKAADGHESHAKSVPAKVTQSSGRLAVTAMRAAPR